MNSFKIGDIVECIEALGGKDGPRKGERFVVTKSEEFHIGFMLPRYASDNSMAIFEHVRNGTYANWSITNFVLVNEHPDIKSVTEISKQRKLEGKCPQCGELGPFINCVMVCSTHGIY